MGTQLLFQEAQREYIAMAHGLDPSEDDVPASGLYKVVTAVSSAMSWHKFYTVGPTEARSWVIPLNTTAVEAAGRSCSIGVDVSLKWTLMCLQAKSTRTCRRVSLRWT